MSCWEFRGRPGRARPGAQYASRLAPVKPVLAQPGRLPGAGHRDIGFRVLAAEHHPGGASGPSWAPSPREAAAAHHRHRQPQRVLAVHGARGGALPARYRPRRHHPGPPARGTRHHAGRLCPLAGRDGDHLPPPAGGARPAGHRVDRRVLHPPGHPVRPAAAASWPSGWTPSPPSPGGRRPGPPAAGRLRPGPGPRPDDRAGLGARPGQPGPARLPADRPGRTAARAGLGGAGTDHRPARGAAAQPHPRADGVPGRRPAPLRLLGPGPAWLPEPGAVAHAGPGADGCASRGPWPG